MKATIFVAAFFCVLLISAQSDSVVYLDEVEILGAPLSKYSAGTSIKSISLGYDAGLDAIGQRSSINFKTYGNGQLATISLRGTSASHTNVIWNGLPVNSPTLGQADFSVWPAFLNDEIIVQKGSTSSLFGSGSIGGNVILENSLIREDSLLSLVTGVGSFGNINGGIKIQLNPKERLRIETRVFGSQLENDFSYEFDGTEVSQPNAKVERFGISQKASLKTSKHHLFSEVAYVTNDRQIQPTVTSTSRDDLLTENFRGVVSDEIYLGNTILYSSVGFIGESTAYNDTSVTKSQLYSGNFSVDVPISKLVSAKAGVNYILTKGKSDSYSGIKLDRQYHAFSSFNFSFLENVRMTINLREAIHQTKTVFVPSLGGEWTVLSSNLHLLLKGQISKGYRVPTFNDRFWQPGGNPDLLPESSMNFEIGIDFSVKNRHDFSLTTFRSRVENWIQWQPIEGIWTPRNVREVLVRGLEFSANSKLYSAAKIEVELQNDYEYTRSSDEGIEEDNQLPYIPKHAFASALFFNSETGNLKIQTNYTGERFSTLSNSQQSSIDDFLILDFGATRVFKTTTTSVELSFSINNFFNTSYEVLKNTAMPGRNFLLQLIIKH